MTCFMMPKNARNTTSLGPMQYQINSPNQDLTSTFEGFGFSDLTEHRAHNSRTEPAALEIFLRNCLAGANSAPAPKRDKTSNTGEVTLRKPHGTSRLLSLQADDTCPTCNGTGATDNNTCPQCQGSGVTPQTKRLEVKVPPGVRTGSRVRLAGKGGSGISGGSAGDLFLSIKVKPHPRYERTDDDLHITVDAPLLLPCWRGGEYPYPRR